MESQTKSILSLVVNSDVAKMLNRKKPLATAVFKSNGWLHLSNRLNIINFFSRTPVTFWS